MHQVFVSYARHDAEFARRLVESLDPLYGVWLDHERIAPGARWQRSIEEGIDRCAVFLVVVSPDVGFAKKARQYAKAMNVPLAIAEKQRLDLHSKILAGSGASV